MDPLTQGALGASLPQALTSKKTLWLIGLLGFLSGMAPDLDILVRSEEDPLLFLEYHRQFTHSLIFIPFGGLFCATIFYWLIGKKNQLTFKETWIYCTLGYATHGLLDTCTSYGTLLFWPFSYERVAWNNISIIDPLFTIPILGLIVAAAKTSKRKYSAIAVIWAISYLSLGIYLNSTVEKIGKKIAIDRGHKIVRISTKPSFGNLILWKIIYETNDKFYIDAVRLGFQQKIFPGENINKINLNKSFPWLKENSQQAKDVKRFKWFSNNYIAINPFNKNQIIDIRYSQFPNEIGGLWGIELSKEKSESDHIKWYSTAPNPTYTWNIMKSMIFED